MIIRLTDGSGDWTFGKGMSNYLKDDMAIRQNIQSRVLSWLNDCFWALAEGIDWKNRISTGQLDNLRNEIRSTILQSYGVVGADEVTVDFVGTTRNVTVTYSVDTIYGSKFQNTINQVAGG
jgi:hypothetical protein